MAAEALAKAREVTVPETAGRRRKRSRVRAWSAAEAEETPAEALAEAREDTVPETAGRRRKRSRVRAGAAAQPKRTPTKALAKVPDDTGTEPGGRQRNGTAEARGETVRERRFGTDVLAVVGAWRRYRTLRYGVPVAGVLATVGILLWFTPLLSVRAVEIRGVSEIPSERVSAVLDIPEGQPIMRVDTGMLARRVAAIPRVRAVRVQRIFPTTLRVSVTERTPVLFYSDEQGAHLLDSAGVEYAIGPAPIGVPKLVTEQPSATDPATTAAVTVAHGLPPALEVQVESISARSVSDIELRLRDGRTVVWGGVQAGEQKAAVILPLLTRPGTVFDVSSPSLATVR